MLLDALGVNQIFDLLTESEMLDVVNYHALLILVCYVLETLLE